MICRMGGGGQETRGTATPEAGRARAGAPPRAAPAPGSNQLRVEFRSNLPREIWEMVEYESEHSLGAFLIRSSHDISSNLLLCDCGSLDISSDLLGFIGSDLAPL